MSESAAPVSKETMVNTQSAIGCLVRVPIREVWADEARHFTPWLAENLEYLSWGRTNTRVTSRQIHYGRASRAVSGKP